MRFIAAVKSTSPASKAAGTKSNLDKYNGKLTFKYMNLHWTSKYSKLNVTISVGTSLKYNSYSSRTS